MNLGGGSTNSPELSSFVFAFYLPSQSFLGCQLGFHIFFHHGFLGDTSFFTAWLFKIRLHYSIVNLIFTETLYICSSLILKKFTVTYYLVPVGPTVNILPSDPIQGAMVGSPQMIQCTVSTVSGVESSSVMINWMGPGGDTVTNDSRVIINPITSSSNNYTSIIQFTYLMEGDEGTYTCNVTTFGRNGSASVILEPLNGNLLCIKVRKKCLHHIMY